VWCCGRLPGESLWFVVWFGLSNRLHCLWCFGSI